MIALIFIGTFVFLYQKSQPKDTVYANKKQLDELESVEIEPFNMRNLQGKNIIKEAKDFCYIL